MALWALTALGSKAFYQQGLKTYLTNKVTAHMNLAEEMELADYKKMEQVRARAAKVVEDPDTAEALKPYYRQFCKRPCFHDEYLPTFNRPNVTLVNTDGRGVDQITANGIVFDGQEYPVDCIIFATGFEVGTDYARRAGYQIKGINGMTISEKWADGLSTYHGMHVRGFPMRFSLVRRNPGSLPPILIRYMSKVCTCAHHERIKQQGATRIEASAEAEQQWVQTIIDKARLTADFQQKRTPGYYNNEGS